MCPSPRTGGGGGHTRLRVRGWGSPNSDDWRKSLAICLLCGEQYPYVGHCSPSLSLSLTFEVQAGVGSEDPGLGDDVDGVVWRGEDETVHAGDVRALPRQALQVRRQQRGVLRTMPHPTAHTGFSLRMRSSRVVRASDCQCTSCNQCCGSGSTCFWASRIRIRFH